MTRPPRFDAGITRADFLNAALLGTGASLLGMRPPASRDGATAEPVAPAARGDDWTGYGGVGDYARANGNTRAVLDAAHRLRDGAYGTLGAVRDTGERYDLVVVGGGVSGLTAAYRFAAGSEHRRRCLVLENHPVFGGEARQNEFLVNGVRLIAPQGSNQFGVPAEGSRSLAATMWEELGLPRQFDYVEPSASSGGIRIPLDNYAHMEGVSETAVDVGYHFEPPGAAPVWLRNIWANDLADAPITPELRADLLRWRYSGAEVTEEFRRSLDRTTYRDYLEGVLKLDPGVTRFVTPVIGLINGATPDAVSAFAAHQIGMPGVGRVRPRGGSLPRSFPGGNATYARHLVRKLVPGSIAGADNFADVMVGRIAFSRLDRAGQPTRIRVNATVISVRHAPDGREVEIVYERGGHLERVRAARVIMASGAWITKHVLRDLTPEIRAAYGEFTYAPAMVVNVALTNWRFLKRLGVSACRWFDDGFGFSCNIRRPMRVGRYAPPVDPDQPTVLTFYLGLYSAGHPAAEQGVLGRTLLFGTSYADYEARLAGHLTRLFGDHGFDARRDVAGVILNRWGHARVLQPPGFYYGRDGKPAAREVVEAGYGRIAIGHSELNGHQNITGAMAQGYRAAEAVLSQSG
ncbi:MAG: NAD(P)-binding protein [Gemmatimonadales bacterium]